MKIKAAFPSLLYLMLSATTAASTEAGFPHVELHGLADFRYAHADAQAGWAGGGLGKFRFGGENDAFRINEAALNFQARLDWAWTAVVTAKYAHRQENPVDLTEAFLSYRPVSTNSWRFGGRIGLFFPPVSMENTGVAWSSPYTLSSSAINAWVGQELRVFGGEAQLNYQRDNGDRWGWFAAGFANNDTAGSLVAWQGWSVHDYEATLRDRIPLPQRIGIRQSFPLQASQSQPFVEVDGRPGFYSGLSLERPEVCKLRVLYYDNRGRPDAIENGQYAWHTQFWSLGLKADLPWDMTLISQGISGRTRMGDLQQGMRAVDVDFWSASLLLSKVSGPHRISIRHDRFGTTESDFLPQDRNRESGYAWTGNYNFTWAKRHQLGAEVSFVNSNRPARFRLGQPTAADETLFQVSYRLFF